MQKKQGQIIGLVVFFFFFENVFDLFEDVGRLFDKITDRGDLIGGSVGHRHIKKLNGRVGLDHQKSHRCNCNAGTRAAAEVVSFRSSLSL